MAAEDTIAGTPAKPAKIMAGLHLGLPDHWYPVLDSRSLGDKPILIRRFGIDLALWRDGGGRPHVLENHCPHRGAPLSQGVVHGEELMCSYHGWRFDGAGQCTGIPLEAADDKRADRIRVRSFPVEERCDYIWMFYGGFEDATPLSIPAEIEDDEWQPFKCEYQWETNWLNILDNIIDPLHAIFLHAGATTQKKRATFIGFNITNDDDRGFCLGKTGVRDDGSIGAVEGEVAFTFPNVISLNIADGTKHGLYRVVVMATPVDEGNSCAFYVRARRCRGLSRLRWRLWWLAHGRAVHRVAAQDQVILSGIAPIGEARLREHLTSSDAGVIHLRKRLNQKFFAENHQSG
jgi:phenylpropionate dioxygenase-like ring-hydroxylating dioxygenase large terminal subunit